MTPVGNMADTLDPTLNVPAGLAFNVHKVSTPPFAENVQMVVPVKPAGAAVMRMVAPTIMSPAWLPSPKSVTLVDVLKG
jgi:hypothetical protein